jgi:hypothetical protein
MKIKTLIITILFASLFGCASAPEHVVTKPVAVPLVVCPAPPIVEAPRLMIDELTDQDSQNPDKIAKAYKGSVIQLKAYAEQLAKIVEQYGKTSQQYLELRKQLLQKYPELQTTNPELFN